MIGWIAAQLASWSTAQWTAVIALLVGLYGAGLSTLNFLGARLRLRFNARVDGGTVLQIDVANHGGRSTTLTKIMIHHFESPRSWARLWNRATRTSRIVAQTLPFELQPGGVWSGRTLMDRKTMEALYFDLCLYHSRSTKPVRTRVRPSAAPSK
jgi:hypothetical protein